jgi:uncharacterized protein DUF1707
MSPQYGPPWLSGQTWTAGSQARRRGGHPNPSLRVSDAERTEVADRLSRHYGDGRLDQAEFNERMERAMSAKTHGDFAGLFTDLPDLTGSPDDAVPATVSQPKPRSPMFRIAIIVLIIVAAAVIGQALVHSFFPWLLLGLIAFLWLRHHESHRHSA